MSCSSRPPVRGLRVGRRQPPLARRARARRDRGGIRRPLVCAREGVRRGRPRAPLRLGGDATARRPSLASRRDRGRRRRRRPLRDLDGRGRGRPGARARRARRRSARRRRRGVEPRRRSRRDGRLGARRRRRRVAEGTDDAAWPLARDRVGSCLGALEALDHAAVLLRLGADASCPRRADPRRSHRRSRSSPRSTPRSACSSTRAWTRPLPGTLLSAVRAAKARRRWAWSSSRRTRSARPS